MDEIPDVDVDMVDDDDESIDVVHRWLIDIYEPAIACLSGLFAELGQTPEEADHNARAALARLANLDPPITVAGLTGLVKG